MSEVTCEVCGRKIDSRGLSGHMRTHKAKPDKVLYGHEGDDNDGVISYPSNEQEIKETGTVVDLDESQGKRVKKSVKKTVASKPASSPASKPDPRGQRNTGSKSTGHPVKQGATEAEHIPDLKSAGHPKDSGVEKWQGFFR